MHQFLMRMLSISVKIPNLKRASKSDHAHKELMRALSVRVRSWCGQWAYATETDVHDQCAHQQIKCCLAPPKVKVISLYFSPKVTNPERLYGVKIMKIRGIEISKLGKLQGKFHLCIPFLGIVWPQSQFLHSFVCERFIYFQDWPTCFPEAE